MSEILRASDVAYEAACRIVSPKEIRFGVSLLCALVIACLGLWQTVNDLKAWRDVHQGKIAKLEAQSAVAEALTAVAEASNRQAATLEELVALLEEQTDAE